jgi:hypothetical protein
MFTINDDWNIEIANTEFEMKLNWTKDGIEIITSDDDVTISSVLSYTDMYGLYRWLKMLQNDGALDNV